MSSITGSRIGHEFCFSLGFYGWRTSASGNKLQRKLKVFLSERIAVSIVRINIISEDGNCSVCQNARKPSAFFVAHSWKLKLSELKTDSADSLQHYRH
jgi:hypothetical protein